MAAAAPGRGVAGELSAAAAAMPGCDGVDRERDADEPGRAHQHVVGSAAERGGGAAHMRRAWSRPGSPVAALAFPAFTTTAAARPVARWARG